ncbi:hypothetical protein H0H87_003612, partial [Tephrocybe sp. NHM501043]
MFEQYFSKSKSQEHREIQTREARALAKSLLAKPETDFNPLLLRFSTSLIIDVVYGHQIQASDDPYLQIIDDCSRAAVESGPAGGTPIDLFPIRTARPSFMTSQLDELHTGGQAGDMLRAEQIKLAAAAAYSAGAET